MTHWILVAARTIRTWTMGLAIAALALAGCNSGDEGTGDFSQKFEPPPGAAASAASAQQPKPKSRREMIEEDRARAESKPKSKSKRR